MSENAEFDYQWQNLSDPVIEYTEERVRELLRYTNLPPEFFTGKRCLDAGCGNGRYTYALQRLGGFVDSIDLSPAAIAACRRINPGATVRDLLTLTPNPTYDFVLSWGVLHHTPVPKTAFLRVASQVRPGGTLHVMVYRRGTQKVYTPGRRLWPYLPTPARHILCRAHKAVFGGTVHGWWDALNPRYNFSYSLNEVIQWFTEAGFEVTHADDWESINVCGRLRSD